jgi:hypothetical protein
MKETSRQSRVSSIQMDPCVKRVQQLFWEIEALREKGVYPTSLPQLLEMARLHEERARELLQASDPNGWTDLFAAVTARGEARQRAEAERLLTAGREFAASLNQDETDVVEELTQLKAWLDSLPAAPPVPTSDRTAALAEPVHN